MSSATTNMDVDMKNSTYSKAEYQQHEELSWDLIHQYFRDRGFVKSQINSYNELIYKYIPEVVQRLGTFSITLNNIQYTYSFRNPVFNLPCHNECHGELRYITPAECRLRNLTYQAGLWCDFEEHIINTISGVNKTNSEKFLLCHVPVMLMSELCTLKNRTEHELAELGECMYDHGGYFIVNGHEKVLIAQERMAHNQVFCYCDKKGDFTSELRSVPEGVSKAATQAVVRYVRNKGSKYLCNSVLMVNLHHTKKEIPLMVVFRALGFLNNADIIKLITKSDDTEIINLLQASFEDINVITEVNTALRFIGLHTIANNQSDDKLIEYARQDVLSKELFPHLGSSTDNDYEKAFLLGHMVYKCLITALGKRDTDDRDHLGNKRMELAGNLIGSIFRIAFTQTMREFKKIVEKNIQSGKTKVNFKITFDSLRISKSIRLSISTGNWGNNSSKSNRTGVTQPLHRLTYVSTLSNLRRMVAPIAKEGKLPKPRQLHNSLWARACVTGDTLVRCSQHILRPIEQLQDGDIVWTVNKNTLTIHKSTIKEFFYKLVDRLILITTKSQRQLKCTTDHPLLVYNVKEDECVWKPAVQLQNHDVLIVFNNNNNNSSSFVCASTALTCDFLQDPIVDIQTVFQANDQGETEFFKVYDFTTVNDDHSFIGNDLVQHNCSHETPEGQACGLIKNLSMMSELTVDSQSAPIRDLLLSEDLIPVQQYVEGTKVFVNGTCEGISNNPSQLYLRMKAWKMDGLISYDTSVVYNIIDNEINIMTDGGRCIRPLLYIANRDPHEFLQQLRDAISNKCSWDDMCKMQLIEYVDGKEEEQIMCAMTIKDWITNPFDYQYTHCEIHPSMILGVCASTIPLPDHNQAPRNTYQAGQIKQALGIYAMNYKTRFDTQSHLLWYPQKPLITTKTSDILKMHEMPAGQQCIVAIACHTGFNQEDSILISKSAVDRGLFRSTYYRSYVDVENKYGQNYEEFCIPDEAKKGNHGGKRYDLLDEEDGIVSVGLRVSCNDVIIGKTTPISTTVEQENMSTGVTTSTKGKIVKKDSSMWVKNHEEGIVDAVMLSQNEQESRIARVRVRKTRTPEVGDKLASRAAQKGTIGLMIRQEDMPFTAEGLIPDLIINSHCIPSRMTIGQLLECVMSKSRCVTGKMYDATPFQQYFSMDDVCADLKEAGFEKHGWEVMYNGATGKPLTAMVFMGPTYYQRLKHMVADKHHSRATGMVQTLTRQPTEGRSKDGGLRFGEMERDSLIAHGASSFLREKLFLLSDKYKMPVCDKCGLIGHPDKLNCKNCKEGNLYMVEVPYACKLLFQELLAMNIAPRVRVNTLQSILPANI